MLILIVSVALFYLAPTSPPYYFIFLCAAGALFEMIAFINEFVKRF